MDKCRFSLYVKAMLPGKQIGDCPFSARVIAVAKIKIPSFDEVIDVIPIDLTKKPADFLAKNPKGHVPFFVDKARGATICESGAICQYIDKMYPGSDMKIGKQCEAVDVTAEVFGKFHKYMMCKESSELEELKNDVIKELCKIDQYLKSRGNLGMYLLNDNICDVDCCLMPKLMHVVVAGKEYRDFMIPEELTDLVEYYERMKATRLCSFMTDTAVIKGWARHM